MNEQDGLTGHLVDYLEADTTLMGMVNAVAPEAKWGTLASPFVRVDYLDGEDLMVIGLHRVWSNSTWHIRGCLHWRAGGRRDRTDVDAIGARLDELLHDHEETTATMSVHSFREEPTPSPSLVESNGGLATVRRDLPGSRRRCLAAVRAYRLRQPMHYLPVQRPAVLHRRLLKRSLHRGREATNQNGARCLALSGHDLASSCPRHPPSTKLLCFRISFCRGVNSLHLTPASDLFHLCPLLCVT